MKSLAVKYRPSTWEEVCGQTSTIRILKREVETNTFVNAYLFCGASGCGKTTCARIFANEINKGKGGPIEIDAASYSGVDSVREIIKQSQERSLDSEYKIYIIDECVTGDTEVLTDRGWKRFDSLDRTEKIAQYSNGKIEFVSPYEYIDMEYSGKMYNISVGNKASFMFSPNHVQPLYYDKSGKTRETYVKDVKFCQTNRLIRSGESSVSENHLSIEDRIAICLQADGTLHYACESHNYWTITVKKNRKKERLLELLHMSNLEYKEIKTKTKDAIRLSIKTNKTVTKKLSTHFNLSKMSYDYACEFIDELMNWDGYINKKYLHYSCVDKDNVDFCQCVATICGFSSRIGVQKDERKDTYSDCYRLYLQKRYYSTPNSHIKKLETNFSGRIYCVKVPSHMIIIRKDGYEMVTGNCHALSSQAWQAFLKGIEEPPKYTIYIFCTTEQNKVPKTIMNRVQRFNFTKFPYDVISSRLKYIVSQEHINCDDATLEYIAKISGGGMRDAISYLDTVASYTDNISVSSASEALGNYSYDTLIGCLNNCIDCNIPALIGMVNDIYMSGKDLKLFVSQMIQFCLDVEKYFILGDISVTSIPAIYEEEIKRCNLENAVQYYSYLVNTLLDLKNLIKDDPDYKCMVEIYMLKIARCE